MNQTLVLLMISIAQNLIKKIKLNNGITYYQISGFIGQHFTKAKNIVNSDYMTKRNLIKTNKSYKICSFCF